MRLHLRLPTWKQLLALCICTALAAVLLILETRKFKPEANDSHEEYRLEIPPTNAGSEGSSSREQCLAAVCADTACGEKFLLKFAQQRQQPPIPAIRHIQWRNENVSKYLLRRLKSWKRVHPDWTFVLWRDSDVEPFVRQQFPGKTYRKFKSLPEAGTHTFTRIDMFRYLLLYRFGGVYADLDYSLVSSLDTYRRYAAVVTRQPEAHAVQQFGLTKWPLSVLANAALYMSAPGHPFFSFALHQLVEKDAASNTRFAGPHGLSRMLSTYYQMHLLMVHPAEFVYIPPSYSFYPYKENRLNSGGGEDLKARILALQLFCGEAPNSMVPQVQEFCKDVTNLDAITDKNQPVIAIRDIQKKQPVSAHSSDERNMTLHFQDLQLGNSFA